MGGPPLGDPPPRLTVARLFGIDRSGPPPPETLAGAPWRPWTIPNAIGYVRLGLIPVFVVIAFGSDDGKSHTAALVFLVIACSDYLDGITARITGQYSRLGALLDPVVDRLLILSGAIVCFHFELLPRWALIVLAVREAGMIVVGRFALERGVEPRVNWYGRLAVFPLMGAAPLSMVGGEGGAEILLYVGLALAIVATVAYVVDARRQLGPSPST